MKKLLAILLSLCILLSCVPTAVIAQGTTEDMAGGQNDPSPAQQNAAPTEETTAPTEAPADNGGIMPISEAEHNHYACACAITGDTSCTHEGQINWQPWNGSKSITNTEAEPVYYYLTGNVQLAAGRGLYGNIVLCLNGYSISPAGSKTDNKFLLQVGSGSVASNVTIMDCGTQYAGGVCTYKDGSGLLNGNSSNGSGGAIQLGHVNLASSLTLIGVRLSGNTESNGGENYGGGAVHVRNGNATIQYSKFDNNKATGVKSGTNVGSGGAISVYMGSVNASNTVFSGNQAVSKGGAIFLRPSSNVSLRLTNCQFSGQNTAVDGAAVYVGKGCSVTATGTGFTGNKATGNGAVNVEASAGAVSITGGSFTGNEANYGSALYIGGTNNVSVSGTSFSGNTAKNGSIYVGSANLNLNDVTISNNAGGLYIRGGAAKVVLTGNTQIQGNTVENTHLHTGTHLELGALGENAKISVSTAADETEPTFITANTDAGFDAGAWTANTKWLRYENSDTYISYSAESNAFYVVPKTTHTHHSCACVITKDISCTHDAEPMEWEAWSDPDSLPADQSGNYYLTTNVVLSAKQTIIADINLCLNGYTITPAEGMSDGLLRLDDSLHAVTVTIMDCATTYNSATGECTYKGGIKGVNTAKGNGAVQVGHHKNTQASALTLIGVELSGNTESNTGENYGGGALHVRNGSATILYSKFDSNKATGAANGSGGAISVYMGSVTASNTVFSGNQAVSKGGAIFLRPGSNAALTLNDCRFSGQNTAADGAAVYVGKGCSVTVTDTDFAGNKATGSGVVNVEASAGTVSITGGSFTGNEANYGGALYIGGTNNVTVSGTSFSDNTAKNGVIYVGSANLNLNDITISNNAGGLYVRGSAAKVVLTGNTQIESNTVENVYLHTGTHLEIGQLGESAKISVSTAADEADADFITANSNAGFDADVWTEYTQWLRYENTDAYISYSKEDSKFYLVAEGPAHSHCICGDGKDAACGHDAQEWTPWLDTGSLPAQTGCYFLVYPVQLRETVTISAENADIRLCLNGKTVTAPAEGSVYSVFAEGVKITITDCTAKTEDGVYTAGKITGATSTAIAMRENSQLNLFEGCISGNPTAGGGGAVSLVKATSVFNMYGGEISGNRAKSGGGIYIAAGATMNLWGGSIRENEASDNYGGGIRCLGTLNMYGGSISGNTAAKRGGGIYQEGVASVGVYKAGTITENVLAETGDQGGGLFVAAGKATLSGAVITANEVPVGGGGAGVVASAGATVEMTGGEISGHSAKTGGGVSVQGGSKWTLSGGVIENNKALCDENGKGGEGGGIYVARNSSLTIAGGNIQGNTADVNGGGVIAFDGSVVTVTGGRVQSNISETGNGGGIYIVNAQLDLKGGYILKNEVKAESGAGVSTSGECVVTLDGTFISENKAAKNAGGILAAGAGTKFTVISGTVSHNDAAKNGGGIFVSKGVALDMQGGMVKYNTSKDGAGIYVYFGEAELSGGEVSYNTASNTGGGMQVTETSTATVKGDVVFNNNKANLGAGICVAKTSKLTMTGGILEANAATKYGAGVALQNQSEFTFSGGQIRGNTAESGGGVLVASGSKMVMSGNASISKNKAAKGYGGGVAVATSSNPKSTLTIKGGTISGNTAKTNGGGVHVGKSTMTMTGGTIRGNTSNDSGAGLYIKESTATLSGGTISGNSTMKTGGGVATSLASTLNIKGVTVSGNSAMEEGGCGGGIILMGKGSVMNFYSGTVTGNKVAKSGGGMYISKNTTINMSGGTISENEAGESGGGMILGLCTTNITGGEVTKNVSKGTGGGISNSGKCLMNISGLTISDNYAEKAGGGMVSTSRDSVLNMTDCVIKNNVSNTNNGGGIYQGRYSYMNLKNVEFSGNTAGRYGGGLYLAGERVTMENVTLEGNEAATYGGGVMLETWSKLYADGLEVHNNITGKHGGGFYLSAGTSSELRNGNFTGNEAGERGAAIWTAADLIMHSLKVTGNTSGKLGTVYLSDNKFDGWSYMSAFYTMSGDMIITDNPGEGKDLYLSGGSCLSIAAPGLGKDSKIGINLKEGLLTDKVYGEYDYEGGDLLYVITYGDRSVTDPEILPVTEEVPSEAIEATEESTEPVQQEQQGKAPVGLLAVAVAALAVVVLLIVLLSKRKKKNV